LGGIEDAKGTGMRVLRCASTAASTANRGACAAALGRFRRWLRLALTSACQATKRAELIAALRSGSKNMTAALADLQR